MLTIFYDGDCPFCTNYTAYQKTVKNVGEVKLVNMRNISEAHKNLFADNRLNINSGIIIQVQPVKGTSRFLQGGEALHYLSTLQKPQKSLWSIVDRLSETPKKAQKIYPTLFKLRLIVLKLLKINPKIV